MSEVGAEAEKVNTRYAKNPYVSFERITMSQNFSSCISDHRRISPELVIKCPF